MRPVLLDPTPRQRRLLLVEELAVAPAALRHRVEMAPPAGVDVDRLREAAARVIAEDVRLRARVRRDGDDVEGIPMARIDVSPAGSLVVELHRALFDRAAADTIASRVAWCCAGDGGATSGTGEDVAVPDEATVASRIAELARLRPSRLQLATLRSRRDVPALRVEVVKHDVPPEHLARMARAAGEDLDAFISAALHVLVARLGGHATTCLERGRDFLELVDLTGWPSFAEVVEQVAQRRAERLRIDQIADAEPLRSWWRHPAVGFSIALDPPAAPRLPEGWTLAADDDRHLEHELRLSFTRTDAGLEIAAIGDAELFDAAYLRGLCVALEVALVGAAADPAQRVDVLPLTRDQLHAGPIAGAITDTIDQAFSASAREAGAAPALISSRGVTTFAELDHQVEAWAAHLAELGLRPEEPVALLLSRGVGVVAPILGILRAGGTYVPLDPTWPLARIEAMVDDCGARIIITDRTTVLAPRTGRTILDARAPVARVSPSRGPRTRSPDQAAYMLYTSGSTGVPKGAVGHHRGTLNRLRWMWDAFPFAHDDVLVQKAPLGFGDSIWELFGGLLRGLPTVYVTDEELHELPVFMKLLAGHRVTRLVVVPALLRAMLATETPDTAEVLARLRVVVSSGDSLPPDLAERFLARSPAQLLNLYGSIEIAADATWHRVVAGQVGERVSIGVPLANAAVRVLDAELQPVPTGVPGDLYVSGALVARGYGRRPRDTAVRFLPCASARMFRTGDVVRWLPPDGLQFLGRVDHQVKLRGMRVELGEVEAALLQRGDLRDAAVVCIHAGSERAQLIAFAEVKADRVATPRDLAAHLATRLPTFMIPSRIVMQSLPRTATGKVDRPALARLAAAATPTTSEAPRGDVEETLARLTAEVLDSGAIGRGDDFFERGGDSLSAMRVAARVASALGVRMRARDVLQQRTVEALARLVEHRRAAGETAHPAPVAATSADLEAMLGAIERPEGGDAS